MKSQADPFETMLPAPMIAPVLARMPGLWSGVAYELSGGEKKLVSLATVLAMEPGNPAP